MWPIYTKLRGKCQIVGDVKVRSLMMEAYGGQKQQTPRKLWSGDTNTENVGEGTEVKDPLVAPEIEKKESPTTDQYHELRRLDEYEQEWSPTNDMEEIKGEDCSGFWHTGKPEREASLGWSADQERALKEISQIIKEQAQHDKMRKNASED